MSEFIAIISAKGGVGKTTASINVSMSLNHFGANTLLVDCDFTSANVGTSLGFPPHLKNLHMVLLIEVLLLELVMKIIKMKKDISKIDVLVLIVIHI